MELDYLMAEKQTTGTHRLKRREETIRLREEVNLQYQGQEAVKLGDLLW